MPGSESSFSQKLAVEFDAGLGIVTSRPQIVRIEQNVMWIESRIEILRRAHAENEKAPGNQQKERHRHLRHHEDAGKPRLVNTAARAAGFLLQHGDRVKRG